MKHLFIVNPIAGGNKDCNAGIIGRIDGEMSRSGKELEIYATRGPMDAADKIRAEAETGQELRVYACGGDGTLNECANGAAGYPNAALTHFPCGTGNDFLRIFGEGASRFRELKNFDDCEVSRLDLIDCNGRLAINVCSVGIDARIGTEVHEYSTLPFVRGTGAYIVSLVANLIEGITQHMRISSGDFTGEEPYSLVCICNGRYYGGGFNPVPEAEPDDGLLDILIVEKLTRLQFIGLVGKYAKGRFRELGNLVTHLRTNEINLGFDRPTAINLDGEILTASEARISVSDKSVNFFHPRGTSWQNSESEHLRDFKSITN